MNKKIDLTKILEDCPRGFELYSSIYGTVTFEGIDYNDSDYPICVKTPTLTATFTKEGRYFFTCSDSECCLFPSHEQRDWSKFTASWYKNEKSPRFKVGDWVVFIKSKNVYQVEKKENYEYTLRNILGGSLCLPFSNEELIREWTIQDAKDGYILATSSGAFIYNGNNGGGSCPGSYCGINTLGNFQTGVEHHWTSKKVYPATKEQCNALMKAMNDAGYKWDAEKKELKKLVESKFDPKTLQSFDRVLARTLERGMWYADIVSVPADKLGGIPDLIGGSDFDIVIPFNEETEHLAGTKDEAPEFYKYWED